MDEACIYRTAECHNIQLQTAFDMVYDLRVTFALTLLCSRSSTENDFSILQLCRTFVWYFDI